MSEQVSAMELRQLEYQKTADERSERSERVLDYMETREAPRQKVLFDGQVYDAFELLVGLVRRAESNIVLVDGYANADTLNILAEKREGVDVTIWTHPRTQLTHRDVETFDAQYPQLEVRHTTAFHDRFLVLDGKEGYFVGASLKDAGKKKPAALLSRPVWSPGSPSMPPVSETENSARRSAAPSLRTHMTVCWSSSRRRMAPLWCVGGCMPPAK